MEQFITPQDFQAHVAWPEDRPNPYGGGGYYAGDEDMAEDNGGDEDMERDDPTNVHSANST